VTPGSFGVIGAWDGHRVQRGRVVVDATWHHFFNINLVGDAGSPDPPKRLGFLGSPAGEVAFEEIKSYFRNIAVWIARPERHVCMRWRALWACRWNHRLLMDLRPPYLERGIGSLDLPELLRVGDLARDVLGRIASRCQVYIWLVDIIKVLLPKPFPHLEPLVDPWWPVPPDPDPDPVPWLHAQTLLDATLGGALYALAAEFPQPDPDQDDKAERLEFEPLLQPAAEVALERVVEAMDRSSGRLSELREGLRP
jgi:hypothetical protein